MSVFATAYLPFLLFAGPVLGQPIAAPGEYVTQNYELQVRSPPHTTICPLPNGWVGSDHGTVIFLSPPASCGGYGYASSDRGSVPDTPRIEVFYGYSLGDGAPRRTCHSEGWTRLLNHQRRTCRTNSSPDVRIEVSALFQADSPAEVNVALVTSSARMARDLRTFQAFTATVRTCSVRWVDSRTGRSYVGGSGMACPPTHWW